MYFAQQNGSQRGPHETEFWLFSNTKINVTNKAQKVDEKIRSFAKFPCFYLGLWSLNCQKKMHFFEFCADSSKESKFAEAIFVYLKDRIALFQKIILFIMLWVTVQKILASENDEFC